MGILCLIVNHIKKAHLFLFSAFFFWVFATSFFPSYPQSLALFEVAILTCLLFWIKKRPERIPSDPPSNTVQVAFYYGIKAPFLAKLASLFNLPFYGIAIVINDNVMMPSKKTKCIRKVTREYLNLWTILDTTVPVNNDILSAFNLLEGAPIKSADCMKVMGGFLDKLGDDYTPTPDPSSYMAKILELRI